MIKNYLRVALRHLKKNKGFSLLNLAGLALGIACAILILLWVGDEISYNRFHEKYDRIYAVWENQSYEGKTYTFSAVPGRLSAALKAELPEIKNSTRADWGNRWLFTVGEKSLYEEGLRVDSSFLQIFSYPLLKGELKTALTGVHSLVITEKMAKKFFGDTDPLGKTLRVNNKQDFTITGVLKNIPENNSTRFEWLAPFVLFEQENPWWQDWGSNGMRTYVELQPNTNTVELNKKLYSFISKKDTSAVAKPFLLAMKDWRLRSDFEEGKQVGGRIEYVRLFSIVAAIIILIACINFMNLATARSEQRAREVGVRKVMGAARSALIRQFMTESFVMAFIAVLLACLIAWLVLPLFNTLVEKQLSLRLSRPAHWGILLSLVVLCGLLAGSYPSLYLSSFNPAVAFKGLRVGKSSITVWVRKGLVVTQFAAGIVLIICTIIIYRQIGHIKNRQLGYDKENILYMTLQGKMKEKFQVIHNELLGSGVALNAGLAGYIPIEIGSSTGGFQWQGKDPTKEILVSTNAVGPTYIPTVGMKLVSGRNFHTDALRDSSSIIINETFARLMGKKNPVGERVRSDNRDLLIVGVVKDFVFNDMYKSPDPVVFYCLPADTWQLFIRLKSGQSVTTSLAKVEAIVKKHNPGYPFEYKFLDDTFHQRFKSESLISKLSRLFAILAVIISCLGLFGLAAYTAERRTKEIGIRKVLGASVQGVVALLSKDFLKLVGIAILIAIPLAWWVMNNWLEDFAYRIDIGWWVFVLAGIAAILIALITVSFQAIKAAIVNPVKSLRTE